MIHICYAVSDKKGTYTKYVGASLCSVFENTKEWVTVHFFHDYTLSTDNRHYLMELVRNYSQQIIFYDIGRKYGKRLKKIDEDLKWMDKFLKHPLSQAMWYRLIVGEIMPEMERLIYLDGDTIVNMDIKELWEEEIGDSGLSAVPDTVIQEEHYSRLVEKGLYEEEKYFNSGVLLINPKVFGEYVLEKGTAFLKKYELVDYPDQDILNYFYGDGCRLLPEKYNTLVRREIILKRENIGSCIYHYAGQTYAIDAVNNYYRLFLEYFTKTPWCNADFLGNLASYLHQYNRSLMLGYANFIAGMRRIIVGEEKEKEKLTKMMMVKENEAFYTLEEFDEKGLRLESDEIIIFFIKPEVFDNVKRNLEACGCAEGVHFINGNVFLYRDSSHDAKILRDA